MKTPHYILVTAARNEAAYLADTIESVAAQTILPQKWLIVSDGSTDDTDHIVLKYCQKHPFIELLRVYPDTHRNFGSKALAINAGYRQINAVPHEFVGILDADITMDPHYYKSVIEQFERDPMLGIAGGVLLDIIDGKEVLQITDQAWSVSGPVQMFRRTCFVAIGGYKAIAGGIDAVAEVEARMQGWKVRAFPELVVRHLRQTGIENHGKLGLYYQRGIEDYRLGYHPLFFAGRCIRRFKEPPYVLGGLLMLAGYMLPTLRRAPKKVSDDFIQYLRSEQVQRMKVFMHLEKGITP